MLYLERALDQDLNEHLRAHIQSENPIVYLGSEITRRRCCYGQLSMPTIAVDKAELYKELGQEYVS